MENSDITDKEFYHLTGYSSGDSLDTEQEKEDPGLIEATIQRPDTSTGSRLADSYDINLGDLRAWKSFNENENINALFTNSQLKHPLDNVDANSLKTSIMQEALQTAHPNIFQMDHTFFSRLMEETMHPNSYYEKIVNSVHSNIKNNTFKAEVFECEDTSRSHLEYMLRAYDENKSDGNETPCVHWKYARFLPNTKDFITLQKSVGCVFSVTSILKEHPGNLRGELCGVAYRSETDLKRNRRVTGACLMCMWLHTYARYLDSNSTTYVGGRKINLNRFKVITNVKGEFCDYDCVNVDSSRLVTLFGPFPIWKEECFKPAVLPDGTCCFKLMYDPFHQRSRELACKSVDPFTITIEDVDKESISLYSLLRIPTPTDLGLEGEFLIPWSQCLKKVRRRLETNDLFQENADKYNVLFKNWFHMDTFPYGDSGFQLWIDACDFPPCTPEYSIFWTYNMRIRTVHYIYSHFKFYNLTGHNTTEHTLYVFALGHQKLFDLMKSFDTFPSDQQLIAHPDFAIVDPDFCIKRKWRCDPVLTTNAVSHISIYRQPLPIETIQRFAPIILPGLCQSNWYMIAMQKNFADTVDLLKYHRPQVSAILSEFSPNFSPKVLFKDSANVSIEQNSIALALYIRIAYAYHMMALIVKDVGFAICLCTNRNGVTSIHSTDQCNDGQPSSKRTDSIPNKTPLVDLEAFISSISDNVCLRCFVSRDASIHQHRRVVTGDARKLLYALKLFAYTHLDLLCAITCDFGNNITLDTEFQENETVLLQHYPTPDRVLHAGALEDMRGELENILLFNKNQTSLEFKKNPHWMVLSATALTNTNKKQFTASSINTYIHQNLEFKKWITTIMRMSLLACYPHSSSIVPIEMAMHWHRRLGGFNKEISAENLCLAINRRKIFVRLCLQEYQIYMCSRSIPLMVEICRRFKNIRQLMCNVIFTAGICNTIFNSSHRLMNTPVSLVVKYTTRHTYMTNVTAKGEHADTLYSQRAARKNDTVVDLLEFDYQCVQSELATKRTEFHEKRMKRQITLNTLVSEDIGGLVESYIQQMDVITVLPSLRVVHQNKIFEYIRMNFVSTDLVKKNSSWIHECTPCNSSVNWKEWVNTALRYLNGSADKNLKQELLIELENAEVDEERCTPITPYPAPANTNKRRSSVTPKRMRMTVEEEMSDDDEEEEEEESEDEDKQPLQVTRAQCIQPLKRLQELQVNSCLPTPGNPCAMVHREVAPTTLYCLELLVSMLCPGDPFNFLWLKVFGFSSESISIIRAVEDSLVIHPHKQPYIRFDKMTPYERYILFALSSYMIQHVSVVNVSIQCSEFIENQIKVLERIHRCPRSQLQTCNGNVVFSTRSNRCCNAIYLTSIGCKDVVNDYTRITNPILIDGDRRTRAKYLTQTMPRNCISVPLVGQAVCFPFQLYSQPTKMTTRMPKRPKTQFSKNGRIGRVGDGGFGSIHKQALCTPGALPTFFFGRNLHYQDHAAVSPPLPLGYSGPLSSKGTGYIPKDYKYCGNNKIRNIVMADCCGCFIRLSLKNFGPWENSVIWCGMCPNSYNMRWLKPCCERCKQLFNIEDENTHLKTIYRVDNLTKQFRPMTLCHSCC